MTELDSQRFNHLRDQIKTFPQTPGVYLMKDSEDRVLYIGKAKSLRERVSSYFQPSADLAQTRGPKIAGMITQVTSLTFLECPSEVDAILQESRLIKDIQPTYNSRQADDKTFPYLEITGSDDFPGIFVTREPRPSGSKLYGPFASSGDLRRVVQVLQRVFKFRTCTLDIKADDDQRRFFRPCILYDIKQCTAPCADLISRDAYREDIKRLRRFLESKRTVVLRQMKKEMLACSEKKEYEQAARIRDEIKALGCLSDRGSVDEHVQPELFQVDPGKGLDQLGPLLEMDHPVRVIEGIDISHIMGSETVGALVSFIDGRPFKKGYRRFRIKSDCGIDDYAAIREVVRRRYRKAGSSEELFPDVILIDGGLGQLHAALEVFDHMSIQPPRVISIAKKEELVYVREKSQPLRLSRNDPTLRLLQYIRDESHRFAQHYHHILRKKQLFND